MKGENCKIFILGMIDEFYVIVVDLLRGIMYWLDWGNYFKIEMVVMDGIFWEILVQDNIQWFIGLVVDYYNEWLYWVDVKFLVIGSIWFNGMDFIVVVDSK